MKHILKLIIVCLPFFACLQGYGQKSLTDFLAIAPISLFDHTSEGISSEEINDLVHKKESATWKISYESEKKLAIKCKYPTAKVTLFLLKHNDNSSILVSYVENGKVSKVETWKKNSANSLEKINLLPTIYAKDFFLTKNQFDGISEYNGNVYYYVDSETLAIKVDLYTWMEKVFENRSLDYDISLKWTGKNFQIKKSKHY